MSSPVPEEFMDVSLSNLVEAMGNPTTARPLVESALETVIVESMTMYIHLVLRVAAVLLETENESGASVDLADFVVDNNRVISKARLRIVATALQTLVKLSPQTLESRATSALQALVLLTNEHHQHTLFPIEPTIEDLSFYKMTSLRSVLERSSLADFEQDYGKPLGT